MSTAIEPEVTPATETSLGEKRFLLNNVAWETYRTMVEDPGLFHVRMTYDRGALELMSPSQSHEYFAHLIGRFIETMTEELGIRIMGSGSTTLRRELLKRGLEPDESYYIQHERAVRGRKLDFNVDPPPDLAIEVEISRSILNKLEVYRALRFPEIWRFDGRKLTVLLLSDAGEYEEQQSSAALPQLAIESLVDWVHRSGAADEGGEVPDENSLIREFRQWVRDELAGE